MKIRQVIHMDLVENIMTCYMGGKLKGDNFKMEDMKR